jgi:hypothetical protein
MLDFRTGQIFGLLVRTLPFVALRIVVYVGIAIGYMIAVGAGAGVGLLAGRSDGAAIGGLVGFLVASGALYWAREYLLYLVKAGHIAVLVELLDGREIPAGKGQIDYAANIVRDHFGTSSLMFGLNQLIRGILRVFNRLTVSIARWLPIPGLDVLVKLVDAVINTSLSHLDQVVLAQILRHRNATAGAGNPWAIARDSVVLYAQNYKGVLTNAVFLTVIVWLLTLLLWVLVAAPVAALIGLFHVHAGVWTFVFALVTALALKAALIDPFAMTALIQVFDRITAGQTPNPEWSAKLESVSAKFRTLTQKARDAGAAPPAPAASG